MIEGIKKNRLFALDTYAKNLGFGRCRVLVITGVLNLFLFSYAKNLSSICAILSIVTWRCFDDSVEPNDREVFQSNGRNHLDFTLVFYTLKLPGSNPATTNYSPPKPRSLAGTSKVETQNYDVRRMIL
jgi:hypothetical protein